MSGSFPSFQLRDSNLRHKSRSDTETSSVMPRPGDKLGHCRIMDLIASGGMANVYKVWHEQLEVVRALKILKPGFTEDSKARLETEAKISANIRHPNIVEVYGVGYWNDTPFIEMEYVDGHSLRQFLDKRGKVSVPFALSVVHVVCTALHYAGNQDMTLYGKVYDGLIHRDIKPANILIDTKGRIKLADFGIARPSETNIHTVESKVMGTFAYLSPEQLDGEKLDQRCDIYALGAVLYEMITGTKAFPQKFLTELLQQKSKGNYTPLGAYLRNAPRQLTFLIEKSLRINRDERQSSIAHLDCEVCDLLRTLSPRQPEEIIRTVVDQIEEQSEIYDKPEKRIWKWYLGAFAVCILALIGAGFFLVLKIGDVTDKKTPPQTTIPEVHFDTSPPGHLDTPPETDEAQPKQPQIKPSSEVSNAGRKEDRAEKPIVKKKSSFMKGIESYGRRDYRSAIPELEKAVLEKTSAQRADSAVMMLADAYLEVGQPLKAQMLLKNRTIEDPFYNLLLGDTYLSTGRLQEADRILSVVSGEKSRLGNGVEKEIMYKRAVVRDGLYLKKPNRENQTLAIRGWREYLQRNCHSDESPKCKQARRKLEQLGYEKR